MRSTTVEENAKSEKASNLLGISGRRGTHLNVSGRWKYRTSTQPNVEHVPIVLH